MSTTFPEPLPPSVGGADPAAWPHTDITHSVPEFCVSLERDGSTVRIVRDLLCGDALAYRSVAWSADYADPVDASDAYEALSLQPDLLNYWSVGATAFGARWLTPTISAHVQEYVTERIESRLLADREADDVRRLAEDDLAAATKITLYYLTRKKMFCVTLERGDDEFWSISFDEKWERDRFGDWMEWQEHRFAEFAEYMTEGDRFELERKLLREMLVTEQAVKKQGLGAGGRRPLRFWRGEA